LSAHPSERQAVSSKIVSEKLAAILERIPAELEGKTVQVGYFEGVAYEEDMPVASVAAIHEFGAPAANIPPRPTMGPVMRNQKSHYVAQLAVSAKAVLHGKIGGNEALDMIGGEVAGDIRQEISNLDSPALSPITVMLRGMKSNDANLKITGKTVGAAAKRVDEGKTNYGASNKPLVDTGIMLDSVTHLVK